MIVTVTCNQRGEAVVAAGFAARTGVSVSQVDPYTVRR